MWPCLLRSKKKTEFLSNWSHWRWNFSCLFLDSLLNSLKGSWLVVSIVIWPRSPYLLTLLGSTSPRSITVFSLKFDADRVEPNSSGVKKNSRTAAIKTARVILISSTFPDRGTAWRQNPEDLLQDQLMQKRDGQSLQRRRTCFGGCMLQSDAVHIGTMAKNRVLDVVVYYLPTFLQRCKSTTH